MRAGGGNVKRTSGPALYKLLKRLTTTNRLQGKPVANDAEPGDPGVPKPLGSAVWTHDRRQDGRLAIRSSASGGDLDPALSAVAGGQQHPRGECEAEPDRRCRD